MTLHTFHTLLIWSDGRTLDSYAVLFDGLSSVQGDLVVCLVTVWKTQVIVQTLHIHIGQNQLQVQ